MSVESVMPSSHLILCRPLLLLPPIPPSIRVFSNESALLMRWPKYWSFSFSIIPSKEIPGLISFRMDWLDLFNSWQQIQKIYKVHMRKCYYSRIITVINLAYFLTDFSQLVNVLHTQDQYVHVISILLLSYSPNNFLKLLKLFTNINSHIKCINCTYHILFNCFFKCQPSYCCQFR